MTVHIIATETFGKTSPIIKLGNMPNEIVLLSLLIAVFSMIQQERDEFGEKAGGNQR